MPTSLGGAATSASARHRRRRVNLTNGPDDGCVPLSGSNGDTDLIASLNCDAAASAGSWRRKPPAALGVLGGSAQALCSPWLYRTLSSNRSALQPSRSPSMLNLSNRRIRTRTYGGVGGEELRDSPLSRSGPTDIARGPRISSAPLRAAQRPGHAAPVLTSTHRSDAGSAECPPAASGSRAICWRGPRPVSGPRAR